MWVGQLFKFLMTPIVCFPAAICIVLSSLMYLTFVCQDNKTINQV